MMRGIFLVLMVLFFSGVHSQEDQRYSFIQYELNKIQYSSDSSAFIRFYQKLDSFSQKTKKQISVAHIGGSHVQGGTWSNAFIGDLNGEFKPSGGGYFIFPYRYAKTNSPSFSSTYTDGKWKKCRCVGKDFCLPLGMSGMSVSSNDSANFFGLTLTKHSHIQRFNSIRVYHNFNPSFQFSISSRHEIEAVRMERKELGYTQFDLAEGVDSLGFELYRNDTMQKDFTLYGFSVESNLASGIYLAPLGANGAASGSFLRCNYFVDQLATIKPDLVIVSLGVNDTQSKGFEKEEYLEHYDSLIMFIRKASPDAAILLTTTTDNFIRRRTSNKRPLQTRDAMYELMNKHNVGVWDLYGIMGGYKSMLKWVKAGLGARDRVHFSPKGYTIIAHLMSEALLKTYHYNSKKQ